MRILDALAIILGIVTLIGSLAAMWILVEVGAGVSALESAQIPEVGQLGAASIQPIIAMARTIIIAGWAFSLCVLLISSYAIYAAYMRIREAPSRK